MSADLTDTTVHTAHLTVSHPTDRGESIMVNDIREMYRALPGLVVTIAVLLGVAALLGLSTLFLA